MVRISPKMALGGMVVFSLVLTGGISTLFFGFGSDSNSEEQSLSVEWNDSNDEVTATITEVENIQTVELRHQSKDFQNESNDVRVSDDDIDVDSTVTITSDDVDGDLEDGDSIHLFVTNNDDVKTIEEIHEIVED